MHVVKSLSKRHITLLGVGLVCAMTVQALVRITIWFHGILRTDLRVAVVMLCHVPVAVVFSTASMLATDTLNSKMIE